MKVSRLSAPTSGRSRLTSVLTLDQRAELVRTHAPTIPRLRAESCERARGEGFGAFEKIRVGDEVPRVVVHVDATVTTQVRTHGFEVARPIDDMFQDTEGDDGVRGHEANVVRRRVDDLRTGHHPACLLRRPA